MVIYLTRLSNRKYNTPAIFDSYRRETFAALETTWIIIDRILFLFMIQEATHQMMHYQGMQKQGEFLSRPLNIRDIKHSVNVANYPL